MFRKSKSTLPSQLLRPLFENNHIPLRKNVKRVSEKNTLSLQTYFINLSQLVKRSACILLWSTSTAYFFQVSSNGRLFLISLLRTNPYSTYFKTSFLLVYLLPSSVLHAIHALSSSEALLRRGSLCFHLYPLAPSQLESPPSRSLLCSLEQDSVHKAERLLGEDHSRCRHRRFKNTDDGMIRSPTTAT